MDLRILRRSLSCNGKASLGLRGFFGVVVIVCVRHSESSLVNRWGNILSGFLGVQHPATLLLRMVVFRRQLPLRGFLSSKVCCVLFFYCSLAFFPLSRSIPDLFTL
jgi:hypothetical protein